MLPALWGLPQTAVFRRGQIIPSSLPARLSHPSTKPSRHQLLHLQTAQSQAPVRQPPGGTEASQALGGTLI